MARAETSHPIGNERVRRLAADRRGGVRTFGRPGAPGSESADAAPAAADARQRPASQRPEPAGVLFLRSGDARRAEGAEEPAFFRDLNLDQIVESVAGPFEDYALKPFFHTPLRDADAIAFRHAVFKDLQRAPLFEAVNEFARQMRTVRERLVRSRKLYYRTEKQAWFLDAIGLYCAAVTRFADGIGAASPQSRGLRSIRDHLEAYRRSSRFRALAEEAGQLEADLDALSYCMVIRDGSITVRRPDGEPDYSADVEATFAKFRQGAVKEHKKKSYERSALGHVEAGVVELVARLYPELFGRLNRFCQASVDFVEAWIAAYDREVHFYLSYLAYMNAFEAAGLAFCCPVILDSDKAIGASSGFDAALGLKLMRDGGKVVRNDFHLDRDERVIVVSGPNQGGKTTFARMFGQLHYLAALGCPVPAAEARLFLFDRLFTHFEREEDIGTLRGKLEDELVRVHEILEEATPKSVVVINEIFTSTTLKDAIFLGKKIMERIAELDLICICVTFIDELSSYTDKTVSMVSTIVPERPAERTFRIVRKPADGLAYALAIAEKYRITYERLGERLRS